MPPPTPTPGSQHLFSITTAFSFRESQINWIIKYIILLRLAFSCSLMPLKFIQAVVCINSFLKLLSSIPRCGRFTVCLTIHIKWYFGCLQFAVIMNEAAKILTCRFSRALKFSFLYGKCPGLGSLGHIVCVRCTPYSRRILCAVFPTSRAWGSQWLCTLTSQSQVLGGTSQCL